MRINMTRLGNEGRDDPNIHRDTRDKAGVTRSPYLLLVSIHQHTHSAQMEMASYKNIHHPTLLICWTGCNWMPLWCILTNNRRFRAGSLGIRAIWSILEGIQNYHSWKSGPGTRHPPWLDTPGHDNWRGGSRGTEPGQEWRVTKNIFNNCIKIFDTYHAVPALSPKVRHQLSSWVWWPGDAARQPDTVLGPRTHAARLVCTVRAPSIPSKKAEPRPHYPAWRNCGRGFILSETIQHRDHCINCSIDGGTLSGRSRSRHRLDVLCTANSNGAQLGPQIGSDGQ